MNDPTHAAMNDPMLYATLKTIHLLALIAWLGGMFFMLACLRPSLGVLDAPARPQLMSAVMGRFFTIVNVAIGSILVTGLAMVWLAYRTASGTGVRLAVPVGWVVMVVLGLVMMAVFGVINGRLLPRLRAAMAAQDAPAGAAAMATIRSAVTLNLALGVIVVVAMRLAV